MQAISLFSGIGGLDLGFISVFQEDAVILEAVEKEEYRRQILIDKFDIPSVRKDIKFYHPHPFEGGNSSVVFGGFPCKGTSQAGKREGMENKQSSLWYEQLRVIKEAEPDYVVIENPSGLLRNGLGEVLNGLRSAGYCHGLPQIVSAKELGAWHQRERVFIVAYTNRFVETGREKLPPCWTNSIGSQIERVRTREGLGYKPSISRVFNGVSDRSYPNLNRQRKGWWKRSHCPNWFINKGEDTNRFQRVSALGDSCTPQQAEVAFLRVLELEQNFHGSS